MFVCTILNFKNDQTGYKLSQAQNHIDFYRIMKRSRVKFVTLSTHEDLCISTARILNFPFCNLHDANIFFPKIIYLNLAIVLTTSGC